MQENTNVNTETTRDPINANPDPATPESTLNPSADTTTPPAGPESTVDAPRPTPGALDAAVQAIYGMRSTFLIPPNGRVDLQTYCKMLMAYLCGRDDLSVVYNEAEFLILQARGAGSDAPSGGHESRSTPSADDFAIGQRLTERLVALIRDLG